MVTFCHLSYCEEEKKFPQDRTRHKSRLTYNFWLHTTKFDELDF
ncbi:MAG: hypothetical protein PHW04_12435 [Candidatus Wallbacteria bacterium]|nr:hypothetical protein [Candidatus Wallbacteria bacterium]